MPLDPLRLDKLQKWIDDGRIDPNHVITMKTLVDSGLMSNIKYGVKVVAHVLFMLLFLQLGTKRVPHPNSS